jgi:CRISPR-associated endonuclease/helicase Cas3
MNMSLAMKGFWGKARECEASSLKWHPLVFHMLDVAACAQEILHRRSGARTTFVRLTGLPEDRGTRLAILVAALHDLGKFAPPFQKKAEGPVWPYSRTRDEIRSRSEHDRDGLALWQTSLAPKFTDHIWQNGGDFLNKLIGASVGHHGRAVSVGDTVIVSELFQPEGIEAAVATLVALIDLFQIETMSTDPPSDLMAAAASFWFAGCVTVADWAGSNQRYFPYTNPETSLEDYWAEAQDKAKKAITSLGLASAKSAELKSFVDLTQISKPPSPLQRHASDMALPDGPTLIIIEDVTGAGKTEAAQILVNRLMADGRTSGAYWAMPTQATANAMYERQSKSLVALFADDAAPQLVLAHGGARLHEGFRDTVWHEQVSAERSDSKEPSDETATAGCAAFLADDARVALIADIGAGTIDQALLGVLPSRFNTVRLFGLSDKVLVIDEAHAYDAYMGEELRSLLKFHAAMGGSAIVLSATLPRDVKDKAGREQIAFAWREGCGISTRTMKNKKALASNAYPLITTVSAAGVTEDAVEAAPWSHRKVPVRCVTSDDDVLSNIIAAARTGAAVAWIRNTVDDAIASATAVRAAGFEPILFHARFAQIDRQRIEAEVMARLGPHATSDQRRGCIVVATQAIEQSLDLDVDLMATDLAPVDLLIQRAGRLRRHDSRDSGRPDVPFELVVKAPAFSATPSETWLSSTMASSEYIYGDPAILWRSMRALLQAGGIQTPGGLRDLIEQVYGATADVPPGLDAKSLKARGAASAERSHAGQSLLNLTDGYSGHAAAWVGEDHPTVRTRLGAAQSTLRLARVRPDGSLEPWAAGNGPLWRRWAMSEVKVSNYRAPEGSSPAGFEAAAAIAKADWGMREQDRKDLIILPLVENEGSFFGILKTADGKDHQFKYTAEFGLQYNVAHET